MMSCGLAFAFFCAVMSMNVPQLWNSVHIARNSVPGYNPDWCATPGPQANFLSRAIARCSKPIYENFPLGPVAVKISGITVREHCRLRGCRFLSALEYRASPLYEGIGYFVGDGSDATIIACGVLAYVEFVRPIAAFDYRVEACGLQLSFLGTILGLVTLPFPRWFSSLALAARGKSGLFTPPRAG
jgi:hypothetical protein